MYDAAPATLSKPSLLFLCHRIPFPPDKGEKIRAFRILEHLRQRYSVHVGCFIDDDADIAHVGALQSHCTSLGWFPRPPRTAKLKALVGLMKGDAISVATFASAPFQAWVRQQIIREKPDVIFVYSSAMAQFMLGIDRGKARLVMDFVDVDSDKWRQYARTASIPMKWVYSREARKMLEFDRRVAGAADASLFVSDMEAALFRTLSPETAASTYTVANGVDCDYFSPAHRFPSPYKVIGPHLVFTGTMDYRPNVDAVVWFADEIFPAIRARHPQASFTIAGAKPAKAVSELGSRPGITVTGRLPDVRPFIAGADMVVAPLRIARAIQNKVLEGMAMGKPVITTPQGLEGIAAGHGEHLLVAETAEAFIQAVLEMTPTQAAALGAGARELMESAYGWPKQLAALDLLVG